MTKFNIPRKGNKQSGFTLLELLLVLGIIAVLAIAAFVIYPKVQASNRAQTESENIQAISAGIKALYASNPDYTNLTDGIALSARIYPSTMVTTTGAVVSGPAKSSFGQAVTVAVGAATSTFTITYALVPSDVCVKLGTATSNSFTNVLVGTKTIFTNGRMDPSLLSTQCATADPVSSIVFTGN